MNLPLYLEIDFVDPVCCLAVLEGLAWPVLLESGVVDKQRGRFSFLAVDPPTRIVAKNGCSWLNGQLSKLPLLDLLRECYQPYLCEPIAGLPPFQGGIAGYFAYDFGRQLENVAGNLDDGDFPDASLGIYDLVLGFDLVERRAFVFSTGYPELEPGLRKQKAELRLAELVQKLARVTELPALAALQAPAVISSNFNQQSYEQAVAKVINYIAEGDIFEANIAQRFQAQLPASLTSIELYRRLRKINPAPFAGFLQHDAVTLVSASPERFLQMQHNLIEARPIKGTRPRSADKIEDQTLADELLASEKDWAENVMIVDLMRNDLSRVCEDFSVQVPQLCGLESFTTVHHLVSVVTGQLKPQYDVFDLLQATLPGGSITGAPKIRAMEIISEIEPTARGPYCGNLGYISFSQQMDLSILIRTFAIKNQRVTYQAGGAIVLDSDPSAEYAETLAKAQALTRALTDDSIN